MPFFDIILIVAVSAFVVYGLRFGFVQMFGGLLGTVIGAFLAARMYEPLALWINQVVGGSLNAERIIAFFLIFALVNRVVGILFFVVDKIFSFLSFVPFLKLIDRLLGGVLGFAEGVLVVGLTLWFASHFPVGGLQSAIRDSELATQLMKSAFILLPFIPAGLRAARDYITSG